jgi:hypothetical protein
LTRGPSWRDRRPDGWQRRRLFRMVEAAKHVLVIVGVAWVLVITLLVFLYAAGWRFRDD